VRNLKAAMKLVKFNLGFWHPVLIEFIEIMYDINYKTKNYPFCLK
jgi:hypothetical protein